VRCSLFAGSVACPCQGMVEPLYPLRCLLAQASQHLWLVNFDDVYREFTCVHHTIHPAPSPPDAGRDTVPSRFGCQSGDCGYRVRRLCTGRDLPAHLRRILLMEQQVWSIQLADNQPCDLVSQLPLNPMECVFYHSSGGKHCQQYRVDQGNRALSCSHYLRVIGLPLNSMESGPDTSCQSRGRTFSPEAELSISLPRWCLGWDVFCWINWFFQCSQRLSHFVCWAL